MHRQLQTAIHTGIMLSPPPPLQACTFIPRLFLCVMAPHLCRSVETFDAILTDPPYGARAGSRKVNEKTMEKIMVTSKEGGVCIAGLCGPVQIMRSLWRRVVCRTPTGLFFGI